MVAVYPAASLCHFGEWDIASAWHVDPGSICVTVPEIPWREQLRRYEWVTLLKLRTTIYTYRRRIGIAPLQELRRLQILFYEFDYCWTMSVMRLQSHRLT